MSIFAINMDIVDFTINSNIEKVAELVEDLTERVKSAYIPTPEELMVKSDNDFAVILYKNGSYQASKFPMYTSELTELNMSILAKIKDTLPEELVKVAATNLTAAANNFGIEIPKELNSYNSDYYVDRKLEITKLSHRLQKQPAETHVKFALRNHCPIDSISDMKKTAEWFNRNHHKLSLDELFEFVDNFNKQAEVLDFSVSDTVINKYASLDKTQLNPDLKAHLSVRQSYIPDDDTENENLFFDILKEASKIGPEKTAYLLELCDQELNLQNLYGQKIANPATAVFGIKKVASINVDGVNVTLDAIRNINDGKLAMAVGNGVVSELRGEDGLDVLASLPTPIKRQVLDLL